MAIALDLAARDIAPLAGGACEASRPSEVPQGPTTTRGNPLRGRPLVHGPPARLPTSSLPCAVGRFMPPSSRICGAWAHWLRESETDEDRALRWRPLMGDAARVASERCGSASAWSPSRCLGPRPCAAHPRRENRLPSTRHWALELAMRWLRSVGGGASDDPDATLEWCGGSVRPPSS